MPVTELISAMSISSSCRMRNRRCSAGVSCRRANRNYAMTSFASIFRLMVSSAICSCSPLSAILTCCLRHSLMQRFLAMRMANGTIPICCSMRSRNSQSLISVSWAMSSAQSSSLKNCRPILSSFGRSCWAICSNSCWVILFYIRMKQ